MKHENKNKTTEKSAWEKPELNEITAGLESVEFGFNAGSDGATGGVGGTSLS